MINSFLNLCRVCPVPTDEKVNSEYTRNFTWHEGYQSSKADVVKKPPAGGFHLGTSSLNCVPRSCSWPSKKPMASVVEPPAGTPVEPQLSRKKKHPELAYRTHELLQYECEEGDSSDSLETVASTSGLYIEKADQDSRARSEERNNSKSRPAPRSRSADSNVERRRQKPLMIQSYPPPSNPRGNPTPHGSDEIVMKTTEYRSQFAWPRSADGSQISTADKIIDGSTSDIWNYRNEDDEDAALDAVKRGRIKKTEYKAKFRPFSAYTYVDGSWKKSTRLIKDPDSKPEDDSNAWYTEVVERLKKADEYRWRSHVGLPLYGDQPLSSLPPELAAHLRDRTILSPVSIASTPRSSVRDEKPKEKSRPAFVPVGVHRKDKSEESPEPRSPEKRKDKAKKKAVRPKSAEPVISPSKGERKSPKHQPKVVTTPPHPRAPSDLPIADDGSLKKKHIRPGARATDKPSPLASKPRPVPRPVAVPSGVALVNGDDGKVWLKPAKTEEAKKESPKESTESEAPTKEDEAEKAVQPTSPHEEKPPSAPKKTPTEEEAKPVPEKEEINDETKPPVKDLPTPGEGPVEEAVEKPSKKEPGDKEAKTPVNGETEDNIRPDKLTPVDDKDSKEESKDNSTDVPSRRPIPKPPMRVALTTVKSPEEVTGVRSPDPETWTVPLEIGKGLQWTDGKTPEGVRSRTPPIILPRRFKESSLVGKPEMTRQKDMIVCDPGSASTGDTVDL